MSELIANIDKNPNFRELITKQIIHFDQELEKTEFVKNARKNMRLVPQDASIYFHNCIAALEAMMKPHINAFSSTRWFYYLRRLPNIVFEGNIGSTLPNTRAIAEIYALSSKKYDEPNINGTENIFKVDSALIRHLARYLAFIEIIYDLQICYRYAGKGIEFLFSNSMRSPKSIPHRIPDLKIENAISTYDKRHDVGITGEKGTGIVARFAGAGFKDTKEDTYSCKIRLYAISDEKYIKISELIGSDISKYSDIFPSDGFIRLKYGTILVDLAIVFKPYQTAPLINYPPSIYTLHSAALLIISEELLRTRQMSAIRVAEVGYFIVEHPQWEDFGKSFYPTVLRQLKILAPQCNLPATFVEFSTLAVDLQPSPWPIRHGASVKRVGKYVYIDMWSISNAFLTSYQHPREQGAIANGRALRFEDEVQAAIDDTVSAPTDELRLLRQKPLKNLEGKTITDIDAIAFKGETLILISCKSIIYTSEYDKGDYNVIRNGESTIVKAHEYWNTVIAELRQRPVGKNFDLSSYKKIEGVVCTPFVVYTADPNTLAELMPGLRNAASLDELVQWLEAS